MPPKTSTPKIIIKPLAKRRGRPPRLKVARPPSPSPVESIPEEPEDEVNEDDEADDSNDGSRASSSQLPSASVTPGASQPDDETEDKDRDVDTELDAVSTPGGDHGDAEAEVDVDVGAEAEDAGEVKPRRGRGRPRGRPKSSGTGTPRTRGKARGRGRGRGRGTITIKLPRRGGEEGQEEGTEMVETTEDALEREESTGPVASGKPFKTIQGKMYIIDNDEFVTENDPKGDTKIDAQGNLLGGRKFKAQTFTLPNRHPERKYMLAIDAARTSGFRDSLYYFRRNLLAIKLNATQWEKDHLIEQGKLGSHLRTRSVTLVTARSAYKLHGAKMLIDGRWVVDDYYEDKVLEEITAKGLKAGDLVGELQDPNAPAQQDQSLNAVPSSLNPSKSERSGGASGSMYKPGGPTTIFGGSGWGPYSDGPLNAVRKSLLTRDGLNEENWMLIASQRTLEQDEEWKALRRENLRACGGILGDLEEELRNSKRSADEMTDGEVTDENKRQKIRDDGPYPLGVYEPQTGIVLYRSDTQPTTSRWEAVPEHKPILGGSKVGSMAWGLAWVDTAMQPPVPPASSP